MLKGFFTPAQLNRKAPLALIPKCGECKLNKTCLSPKMPVSGEGQKEILVVGEAPGKTEDEQGKPFVGSSGQLVQEVLRRYGIELRRDCWVTNAAICRPPGNNLPERAIDHCRPNLINTIKAKNPKVIILFGAAPIRSLLEWLWKDEGSIGGVSRWAGYQIPCQKLNAWICPTYHPSYLLHERNEKTGHKNEALELFFDRHLEAVSDLTERPWKKVPDYRSQIQAVVDTDLAANLIDSIRFAGHPAAFDFETDRLKPDHEDSQIICCAVSNGKTTVAYPWQGKAVKATSNFLASDCPKIGYNIRFEQRWAVKHDLVINNWVWDGMLAAHVIDSRPQTKSLEFQTFVTLGKSSFKEFKDLMKSKGGHSKNRLHQAHLPDLLAYCGTDALLEWKLAQVQRKGLGWEMRTV